MVTWIINIILINYVYIKKTSSALKNYFIVNKVLHMDVPVKIEPCAAAHLEHIQSHWIKIMYKG